MAPGYAAKLRAGSSLNHEPLSRLGPAVLGTLSPLRGARERAALFSAHAIALPLWGRWPREARPEGDFAFRFRSRRTKASTVVAQMIPARKGGR